MRRPRVTGRTGVARAPRSLPLVDLVEVAADVLLQVARDLLVVERVGRLAGGGGDLALDVDHALTLDRRGRRRGPFGVRLPLAELLFDLRGVLGGLVGGLGAVALAAAATHPVLAVATVPVPHAEPF